MTWHVFITTPRAGLGGAVAPYTVETSTLYSTREQAQAVADTKALSAGVIALFAAMPPVHPPWATGAFLPLGTWRSYGGKTWSIVQAHVPIAGWEPPNVPALWSLVQPPGATEWAQPVAYALPTERSYSGRMYRLLQSHTSQAGWTPPAVPALWQDIGSALEVPAYSRAQWWVVDTTSPDYAEVNRGLET